MPNRANDYEIRYWVGLKSYGICDMQMHPAQKFYESYEQCERILLSK